MDASTVIYIIVFILILGVLGFVGYLMYDYTNYKKDLKTTLVKSSRDINYNFKQSSSNITDLYGTLQTVTSNINDIDVYTQLTSNNLSQSILLNSNSINTMSTNFNRFNTNLNKYFSFKDAGNNISQNQEPNNKIFNYIFGASAQQNLDLIAQTTAISGMTIKSDVNKELKICSSANASKCIKMNTDLEGNFIISSGGSSNILFKNNDNNTMANMDTYRNVIYLGGGDSNSAAMYIRDNDVYVKNLRLISGDKTQNRLVNYDANITSPVYTKCNVNISNGTTTKLNTTIIMNAFFDTPYILNRYKRLYVDNPYILTSQLDTKINIDKTVSKYSGGTPTTSSYILLTLKDNTSTASATSTIDTLSSKLSYSSNLTINFDDTLNVIPAGYSLEVKIVLVDSDNITTLSNSADLTFITNSYFMVS